MPTIPVLTPTDPHRHQTRRPSRSAPSVARASGSPSRSSTRRATPSSWSPCRCGRSRPPSTSSSSTPAGIGAIALLVSAVLGWYLVAPHLPAADPHRGHRGPDRRRRPDPARRRARHRRRGRVALPLAQLHARPHRAELRRARGQRGEDAPLHRRRLARAAHARSPRWAATPSSTARVRCPPADAVTGAMGRIESEAHRMSGLVEDLLTLARLDGERPLELQTVDLAVLAADAAQDARTIAPGRHIVATGIDGPIEPTELRGRRAAAAPGRDQPRHQRARAHPGGHRDRDPRRAASTRGHVALHVRDHGRRHPRGRTGRTSSSASTAPTGPAAAARAAATASGSPSCTRSSRPTAARCGSRRPRAAGATFVVELPVRRAAG